MQMFRSDIVNKAYCFRGELILSNASILLIFGTKTKEFSLYPLSFQTALFLEYPLHIFYHYITG